VDNILTGISVLMIFLGLFVDLLHRESERILQQPKPSKDEDHLQEETKRELAVLFYIKSVPLTLTMLLVSYLLLPTTVHTLSISRFSLVDFDVPNTIFIFINVAMIVLFSISLSTTIRVGKRYSAIKKASS
jgi:hypothetical protein